jgi:alkylation response protein AidB-like acyl-CoA dehydrogenase
LGAFSLSEPQSGSDAAGLRLAAKRTSDGYRLTGTKVWCSNAGFADLYLVIARTGEHRTKGISSFLVPKDAPGFRIGKLEKKLGLRASTLAELIFEDCFIPEGQRLGAEGEGFSVALSQLDGGRIAIGTAGVGASIDALERAWKYLQTRPQQFGEGVQQIFAEHFAGILAVKSMIQQISTRKDRGENISALGAAIKLMGSDLAVRVAGDAVQYMGEAGVCREYEVERVLRDAKALQIVEGTNQIQRLVLSREIAAML